METNEQVLRTRDDKRPVSFSPEPGAEGAEATFNVAPGSACSWAAPGEPFGSDRLRSRIEPWLTSLFQSEHLSLVVGSGLTQAVHGLACGSALPGMKPTTFSCFQTEIDEEAQRVAEAAGRSPGNIEDQIRSASELLRGLEIASLHDAALAGKADALRADLSTVMKEFADSILLGEQSIASANAEAREAAFDYLVSFMMSFASRTGTRDRLQIFTTNYDRVLEAGADLAGLHLLDRFVGSVAPIFRASRLDLDMHYNPPGIRGEPRYVEGVAKFTKLHGSVDWVQAGQTIRRLGLPFGARNLSAYLEAPGFEGADPLSVMIYPNAAKDRETASYPYVELLRDFAATVCRPNSTVVTFGYGFGDEHINRVVEDMLTIPSTHLVVIAYGDPLGRIMRTYERLGRGSQITLLVGNHLGDLRALVDNYLPKPSIDRATFRMSELLKARWTGSPGATLAEPMSDSTQEGPAAQ
ncbi:MAG: SIR2 family protein [Coriobacteriia bacterium]|nr:SIR2 family protein [Coriobacteriia bacterium]